MKVFRCKDVNRSQKLYIQQLNEMLHTQKIDVAAARKVAEEERLNANNLRKHIENLTMAHHQEILEMKRETETGNLKLAVQIDKEKSSKQELKAQLLQMSVERDDSNGLMLQYKDSVTRHKKAYDDLENEARDVIR